MLRYNRGEANLRIDWLTKDIEPIRVKVVTHPMYNELSTIRAINTFIEYHVLAVWDFMSLLKSLQQELTCVNVPWIPIGATGSCRLTNDIVLVEESDKLDHDFIGHFELYLRGMTESGASTAATDAFIACLRDGQAVPSSLEAVAAPKPSADCVRTTWDFIENAPMHYKAAAFAFGREDLIPDMFDQVVAARADEKSLDTFCDYLVRHIQVDGEEHTPMAMQMLAELCGDDDSRWKECDATINRALEASILLWDGILAAIEKQQAPTARSHR
jgi:hypothetical protein